MRGITPSDGAFFGGNVGKRSTMEYVASLKGGVCLVGEASGGPSVGILMTSVCVTNRTSVLRVDSGLRSVSYVILVKFCGQCSGRTGGLTGSVGMNLFGCERFFKTVRCDNGTFVSCARGRE